MNITVNGATHHVADAIDVAALVAHLGYPDRGVAVAVDDAVVPRGSWSDVQLQPDAHIEILTAVQGG